MTKTERYNTAPPSSDNVKYEGVTQTASPASEAEQTAPVERGGPKGPEPTRYGDWEAKGRCTDF